MKTLLIIIFAAGLSFSGFASHKHQTRKPPSRHHAHQTHHVRHGPYRKQPPPKIHPVIPSVIAAASTLVSPYYVWVEGRYETVTTVLPNGQVVTSTVWKPGYWLRVR